MNHAELLRAMFPLTARHHVVACYAVAMHYAFFPLIFTVSLIGASVKNAS